MVVRLKGFVWSLTIFQVEHPVLHFSQDVFRLCMIIDGTSADRFRGVELGVIAVGEVSSVVLRM